MHLGQSPPRPQRCGCRIRVSLPDLGFPRWRVEFATGNVFGSKLDGFALEQLRLSAAFGLRATDDRDHSFDMLFGIGTESFENGTSIEAFRLS